MTPEEYKKIKILEEKIDNLLSVQEKSKDTSRSESKFVEGEFRYDRHLLVWVYVEDEWQKFNNASGEQVSLSEATNAGLNVIWPFEDEKDDPSDVQDPRITSRLERIESMLNTLLDLEPNVKLDRIEEKIDNIYEMLYKRFHKL